LLAEIPAIKGVDYRFFELTHSIKFKFLH
jgi:hypothetical protein